MRKFEHNKKMPGWAKWARSLETVLGAPFNFLERLGFYVLVLPSQWALANLDHASHRLEGSRLKWFLERAIFPFALVITLIIGFELSKNGASLGSLAALSLVLLVYGAIFAPLERLMPFSRKWLDGGNDLAVDFMMFYWGVIWGVISKALLSMVVLISIVEWLEPYGHSIWPAFLPGVVEVFLFILLKDFFRYWYHRWMHEIPFMWRWHAVHHSSERLYWLNGIRSHPLEQIVQTFIWAIPLALLQPPPDIVMVSVLMALTIGIFQHANIELKLGYWEYIFSIGDNHRYHHYPIKGVGDSNYGGEFILWDRLFGTFHKVEGERPSDVIGIGASPEYPQTMAGLMIAPFMPDQKVFGPRSQSQGDSGIREEAQKTEHVIPTAD